MSGTEVLPPAGVTRRTVITPVMGQTNGPLAAFLSQQRLDQAVRADRLFAYLLAVQWAVAVGLAAWLSPYTWRGPAWSVHAHVWAAVGLGGLFTAPPLALIWVRPGWAVTRHAVAAGQVLMSALLIHLTGGRIETHFHVFGSLAFLAIYKDWRVLVTATAVVVADHVGRGRLAPESVFGAAEAAPLARTLEHAGWVLFEVIFLVVSFVQSDRLLRRVAEAGVLREVGPYRILRPISSGGMGDVFLAEHQMLKRPCAVKLVHRHMAGDDRAVARFIREVETTARLRHPNTVEIYDYGISTDGTMYYVMEYLEGRSLWDLVQAGGRLPPARAVYLLRQVCGALAEAHQMGVVHRDVSPANVLVCEMGGARDVVKLLDFGLATSRPDGGDRRLTVHGTFLGNPLFVSPEQARGHAVDRRSDLYAVGALAHLLLTGQPPFPRASQVDVLFAQCNEPPTPPSRLAPDVPPELDAVVLRCLEKAPADRFPDADSLEAALAACRVGEMWDPKWYPPVPAADPRPADRRPQPQRGPDATAAP